MHKRDGTAHYAPFTFMQLSAVFMVSRPGVVGPAYYGDDASVRDCVTGFPFGLKPVLSLF